MPPAKPPRKTPPEPTPTIDVAGVSGRINASTAKKAALAVERHPKETLALLRRWLQGEEEKK
jgi:hypothetical protein